MTPSSDLFDLIKSLSKSEKRYFKLQAALQGGEKNYLKLFDLLDGMSDYDPQLVTKIYKEEKIVKNIAVVKNYLYQNILKSIRSFYQKKSIQLQLADLLFEADFLDKKGLYLQSSKLLKKAKKLALDYHKTDVLIKILVHQINIAFVNDKKIVSEVEQLCQELNTACENWYYEISYWSKKSILFSWYRVRAFSTSEKLDEKLEQFAFPKNTPALEYSFYAHLNFYQSTSYLARMRGNHQEAVLIYRKIIALWENQPLIIQEKPYQYKMHLSNFLGICINTNQLDDFEFYLKKFKALPVQNFNEAGESFQNITYLELLYYMNVGQLAAAQSLVPEIEIGLKKYAHKINKAREFIFYNNITSLYFISQKYSDALDWLNKIVHDSKSAQREDLQQFARIMQLVLHYELNNDRVLDYLFQSTYRSLKRQRELQAFERLTLQLLKQLLTATSEKEKRQLFAQFYSNIEALEPAEKRSLGCEELSIWAEAKVKQVTMESILLQRIKTNNL